MKPVHFNFSKFVSRRSFLKSAGVCLALPALESMVPAFVAAPVRQGPKRLVAIGNSFGMYQSSFFPTETGSDYVAPELLQPLDKLRKSYSIFSNLDHGLTGGHFGVHSFLSGVLKVDAKTCPTEISVWINERLKSLVRLPGFRQSPSVQVAGCTLAVRCHGHARGFECHLSPGRVTYLENYSSRTQTKVKGPRPKDPY